MGKVRNRLGNVRRQILHTSPRNNTTILLLHTNPSSSSSNFSQEILVTAATPENETAPFSSLLDSKFLPPEEIAALKIQALFRGHLARQAHRALKSLVKLQALVRGVCVRRQTRMALHCMHTLVRLQIRIRTRQLLDDCI